MRFESKYLLIFIIASLVFMSFGCTEQPVPPPVEYTEPELSYMLLARFDNVFWCDPDFYPVARAGQEEKNAVEQFLAIRANEAEFSAILTHLGLPDKADYTDAEKLQIYREYKKLKYALQITPSGGVYDFSLRVGEGQGERIDGTITSSGTVTILKREASINTCPICLVSGTLIDTPTGQISVERLREGMTVWTLDDMGSRVEAAVIKTAWTQVAVPFPVVRVSLGDGRSVTASGGHPAADGKPLGEYRACDILDGAAVISIDSVLYSGGVTYDFLPSGVTGLYWANHILLKSTLAND